jgi:hypothetical protein
VSGVACDVSLLRSPARSSSSDGMNVVHALAPVVVEGASTLCGRPFKRNPYSREYAPDAWNVRAFGWWDADHLLRLRGQEEAARWLREAEVA